jgi:fructosamine-3-kinase
MNDKGQILFFQNLLNKVLSSTVKVKGYASIGGGCIHNAVKVHSSQGDFFLKYNHRKDSDMFEKEYMGLQVLQEADSLYIPDPIGFGIQENYSFLVMEYIESAPQKPDFWEKFGYDLARLHLHHHDHFGFGHDNYIGRLPQKNKYYENWIDFFIEMRLEEQLKLSIDQGRTDTSFSRRFQKFLGRLPGLLQEESPSLIHGDLWSGNFMVGTDGYAVLIDPAVYYGHREIELSFSRMFGGFDRQFYKSYEETFPLEPGFEERVDIYNVYPYLVHLNLFGDSYLGGIERVLDRYV